MAHIFISYSTKNREYALKLAGKLRLEGFDVWIDNDRLRSSEDWWRSIVLALRGCDAFVVILTPESDDSKWVQREITLAEKYGKPMFPLLLAGDLNSPNWEIFVRIQVEKVLNGDMPPAAFYDYLEQYAPRKDRKGADVTRTHTMATIANDAELAEDIANPPPPTEALPVEALRERASGQRLSPILLATLSVVLVGAIALLLINNQNGLQIAQNQTATTEAAVVASNTAVVTQTALPTQTPSLTPTLTPTLSGTDYELTVNAQMNAILTESVETAESQETIEAATATGFVVGTANSLTETATQWTLTPTPDARQTALARLTETQSAIIASATAIQMTAIAAATSNANATLTQQVINTTATAAQWTATPTFTSSPSPTNTLTPTISPTPTPLGGGAGQVAFVSRRNGGYNIYIMDANGSNVRRLTHNGNSTGPTWSPDGQQIAFTSLGDGYFNIYVMNVGDENAQRVAQLSGYNDNLSWSPDGRQLSFDLYRAGHNDIYVVGVDGNNLRRLTTYDADGMNPVWSPDGQQIAFASSRDGHRDIYVMNVDSSNVRRLTQNYQDAHAIGWSSDGNRILFSRSRDASNGIYIVDDNGNNLQIFTTITGGGNGVNLSPDGKQILFYNYFEGNSDIYTTDLDGSQKRRITSSKLDDYDPVWRPIVQGEDLIQQIPTIEPPIELTASVVGTTDVRIRTGPGTSYVAYDTVSFIVTVTVIGRNEDASWLRIASPSEGISGGWIIASALDVHGDLAKLPIMTCYLRNC